MEFGNVIFTISAKLIKKNKDSIPETSKGKIDISRNTECY